MKNKDKYYYLYEDRYRRIHSQGFEYWISDPDEIPLVISSIDKFLDYACCQPQTASIIEFGCGEGFLADHLLKRGFRYLGVDISESALLKARQIAGAKGKDVFLLADVTDLRQVPDDSFDISIDNQCLHMLVTDDHRAIYLAEVKRVLKSSGKVYFRENFQEKEFEHDITDLRDWIEKTGGDYETLHDYTAYIDAEEHIVHLPRVPGRFNNELGYRKELESAGFTLERYDTDGLQCIMYACVRK